MAVPVFTLDRARARVEEEVRSRWAKIVDQTAFIGGFEVAEFEGAFAEFLGAAGAVGVGNGTDALTVSLRALGLEPGDEVILPALSFYATAEAVVLAGGVPVFADVLPDTLNLDAESAGQMVTDRTVGVIGVHLYGRAFDVAAVQELCESQGLWLIEDAAQAHGATFRGQSVGTFGALAAWSFYPSKNLGCFGDGGCVTSGDETHLAEARLVANHGLIGRYEFSRVGTNSRLDALQAAVLNARLPLLAGDNERRREIAGGYRGELDGLDDLRFLDDDPQSRSVYHQVTVLTSRRDALQSFLTERGIGTSIHYPEPLHRVAPLAPYLHGIEALPVAEQAVEEILCLPIFAEMTDRELDEVCGRVRAFFA